ncbi:Low affinity iron permease [Meira miltonrushii]|uniref:Low affinity iron permease n=1 Tax=Meira miltonrushii TaxID=1280837 RepID=A0A316V585_9BASI|nr:Low affinity iron permease [Meira miltonrushii]PWN32676.1 Low affinity iron permease [Meira miltonrushii]
MQVIDFVLKSFMPLREVEACANDCNTGKANEIEIDDGSATKQVKRLERFIDWLVRVSGSKYTFIFIQICLLVWAFLGIPFSNQALWPIFISDVQAIISYIFDTLLMRQQLTGYADELEDIAKLRSRNASKARMLHMLVNEKPDILTKAINEKADVEEEEVTQEPLVERYLTKLAAFTGHIGFVGVFVLSIIVWLAFGPANKWSNQWQLYINSATSAWMVFLFSLLAVVREGHSARSKKSTQKLNQIDREIERNLRTMTGDVKSNEPVLIVLPKQNLVQTVINVYAYIVGGLVGLFILIIVFAVWVAIGPVMSFNDNWWLLIGTYSGLIGMNDGFVLRNVQHVIEMFESKQFEQILEQDKELLACIHTTSLDSEKVSLKEPNSFKSLSQRISTAVCNFTAHQMTVVIGFISIIGMLVGASVMHWSLTGQLICNVPPSIIESFFMQVLITGHMANDKRKQKDTLEALQYRSVLLQAIKRLEKDTTIISATEEKQDDLSDDIHVEEGSQ